MNGTCGYCKQRNHSMCALTRACECRERGHGAAVVDDDVRALMGVRGRWHDWEYAWSARAGAYRYVNDGAMTTRALMREDNGRARSIAHVRRSRTAQPKRSVTTGSVWNVRAFDPALAPAARASRVTALARGGYGL